MPARTTAILSGLAIGIGVVFLLPALGRTGLSSISIILICGGIGAAFSLGLTLLNNVLTRDKSG